MTLTLSQTRWSPEDIFPFLMEKQPCKKESLRFYEGIGIRMDSLRYMVFQRDLACAWCGLTGHFFLLQAGEDDPKGRGHFNLFAEENGKLVMFSKDHVIPKSWGGKETLENMQTMCTTCNWIKGARADEHSEDETGAFRMPLHHEIGQDKITIRDLLYKARNSGAVLEAFANYVVMYDKYGKGKSLRGWMFKNHNLLVSLVRFHELRRENEKGRN
jgi:hypothetical protein